MIKRILVIIIIAIGYSNSVFGQKILIPMDLSQTDHLKAYGIAFWVLTGGQKVDWLLNYRGGSFMTDYTEKIAIECRIRGVGFENITNATAEEIYDEVQADNVNMEVVLLEVPPRIAVYAPPGAQPWDDAVRLALDYAEIKHDVIWDEEVLNGKLNDYDWLHLHHEDFTGQYGKFYANYRFADWYIEQVQLSEAMAQKLGYSKVSELKKSVVRVIAEFVGKGGFLFAMCSATDSFDITLAAMNLDICAEIYDGDPIDQTANSKLNYDNTFAFENFKLVMDPLEYEFSDIDITQTALNNPELDYFTLFEFSAKWDPVPTMLTQSHLNIIHGFMGQTTAFRESLLKKSVIQLAKRDGSDEIRYIHGNFGRGTFTWYGGHDPEDYRHHIGERPTDMTLHKNSAGYRLILNNVLFPAAKKKKQKT